MSGLFYFQLGLDGIFAAAGFYVLEPGELEAFRHRIVERAESWRNVRNSLALANLSLSNENSAKRMPRGFPDDLAADLRQDVLLKSFTVGLPLSANAVSTADLVPHITRFASRAMALLEFGWRALEG